MAETRYSLVACLEILTPAGEPDQAAWAAASESIHELLLTVSDRVSVSEHRSLQLGNWLVFVQPLDTQTELGTRPRLSAVALVSLAALQLGLWARGMFFRGAVAHGEVLVGTDVIMGPAVREAQQQARHERMPRIIVDPGLLKAMARDPRQRGRVPRKGLARIKSLLAQDSDGLWFLDYLTLLKRAPESKTVLAEHARVIERVLESTQARGEDPRPWLWLAMYHDRVVASLEDIDEATRDSLRIASDTPLRFQF